MPEKAIAVSHPGKIGDALYCLPTLRHLCAMHESPADFYTSQYCAPLRELLLSQSCIRNVIIPEQYKIEHLYCGVQPWQMPIDASKYTHVYQLGFREDPDSQLANYISNSVNGPSGLPIYYEFAHRETLSNPYLVLAPGSSPSWRPFFIELAKCANLEIVVVGAKGEYNGIGHDLTGLNMLDTLPWLCNAQGFFGTQSSTLVLANAFPIPKVAIDDGVSYDMRHVVRGPLNFYPRRPSVYQVLELLGVINYSKTMHPRDYLWLGEAQQIDVAMKLLQDTPYRFDQKERRWSYAMILRALKANQSKTVLDVGGGGSIFAPTLAQLGMQVTQIDPGPCAHLIQAQKQKLGLDLNYICKDIFEFDSKQQFDAVTALHVIEHIEDAVRFFKCLLNKVKLGGLLGLCMDFHPQGLAQQETHLTSYNAEKIEILAQMALNSGFEYFGARAKYLWQGPKVANYNYASLVLKKVR